jgi:hypothetical protein
MESLVLRFLVSLTNVEVQSRAQWVFTGWLHPASMVSTQANGWLHPVSMVSTQANDISVSFFQTLVYSLLPLQSYCGEELQCCISRIAQSFWLPKIFFTYLNSHTTHISHLYVHPHISNFLFFLFFSFSAPFASSLSSFSFFPLPPFLSSFLSFLHLIYILSHEGELITSGKEWPNFNWHRNPFQVMQMLWSYRWWWYNILLLW